MIKKRTVLAMAIFVILLFIIFTVMSPPPEKAAPSSTEPHFLVSEIGRAGSDIYVVYSSAGTGKITLLSLSKEPLNDIYILDQKGIGNERFPEFVSKINELEKYGLSIRTVGPEADVKNGVYIVPTGAMPAHVLEKLTKSENLVVIYIGESDLIIRATTKKEDWYSRLAPGIRKRIIVKNSTADAILVNGEIGNILQEVLENNWSMASKKEVNATAGPLKRTAIMQLNSGSFFRAIYSINGINGIYDEVVPPAKKEISVTGQVFPWEEAWTYISLDKTNGTAYFNVEKEGEAVKSEKLERVSEETFFKKSLKFKEPGDYILKIVDNGGTDAIGIFHVKNLSIELKEIRDVYYYAFSVSVDGKPLKEGKAIVGIKNSNETREFPITAGMAVIPAKLASGKGTFVFQLLGGSTEVNVEYAQESIYEVYLKYGPLGLLVILGVYVIARMNKKQTYTIRITGVAPEIRKEVKISLPIAKDIFRSARKDLKIDGPLKAQEFAVGLKRYITEGADVTEGNVEEILKKMGQLSMVLSWNGYYQLAIDGNIKKNVMTRMIREKLIERGIDFKASGDRFVTRDLELGFFGDRFRKKAIVVFEDSDELKRTLSGLKEQERSRLFLMEFNGVINLISLEQLDEVL